MNGLTRAALSLQKYLEFNVQVKNLGSNVIDKKNPIELERTKWIYI